MKTLWLTLLLSSLVWAERQYFHQSPNIKWEMARDHCLSCFKDLAPITSLEADFISKTIVNKTAENLTSEHWIGLRYNATLFSFRWSNGEPVTYQNWLPGHPVPNKVKKMIRKCFTTTENPTTSPLATTVTTRPTTVTTPTQPPVTYTDNFTCQSNGTEEMCPVIFFNILECLNMTYESFECALQKCTCDGPATVTPKTTAYSTSTTVSSTFTTSPSFTDFSSTTDSTTYSNCILEPEPDPEVYIEDACVALLGFGMWKEKLCNESLPFICYDERFFGEVNVFNRTTSSANLSWIEVKDVTNISHYRVEVTGNPSQTHKETSMSIEITNLTSGNLYKVQVFPVRCGRDLNPENTTFYTLPAGIRNLTVDSVTDKSVFLSWTNPEGGFSIFSVLANSVKHNKTQNCAPAITTTYCNITDLKGGTNYAFKVKAVIDETTEGVPVSVSDFTKPSRVLNITSKNSESTAINATWIEPVDDHTGYCYCLEEASDTDCTNCIFPNCNKTKNNSINDGGKSTGTKYRLCVAALTNNDELQGEMVGILTYTLPNSVTLSLSPGSTYMNANWSVIGNYDQFNVAIQAEFSPKVTQLNVKDTNYTFRGLQAGVYYTVTVITLNGDLKSNPKNMSDYTKAVKPGAVTAIPGKDTVSLTWLPPQDSEDAVIKYKVTCKSKFWKNSSETWTTDRNCTFSGLNPGTIYDFDVKVWAGILSDPSSASAKTVPNKRTLTLAMLCSSGTPLDCGKNATQDALYKELSKKIKETLDGVHWELKWVRN